MRQVRKYIEIKDGVNVGMLFTPRLYSFKGVQGVDFTAKPDDTAALFALYADIMFCAALNLWTLDGNDIDETPFSRADFHEFSAASPKEFGKAVDFALQALTGKGLKDYASTEDKASETAENGQTEVKKKSSRWITRLLRLFS